MSEIDLREQLARIDRNMAEQEKLHAESQKFVAEQRKLANDCACGSGEPRRAAYDARGIFLTYVCDQCQREKLAGYRPDVLGDPDYWHDEPLEEMLTMIKTTKNQLDELRKLTGIYEAAVSELLKFLTNLQSEWESEIENKSEKWHESEAGGAAQGRLDTLSAWVDQFPDFDLDPDELTT